MHVVHILDREDYNRGPRGDSLRACPAGLDKSGLRFSCQHIRCFLRSADPEGLGRLTRESLIQDLKELLRVLRRAMSDGDGEKNSGPILSTTDNNKHVDVSGEEQREQNRMGVYGNAITVSTKTTSK